MKSTISRFIIAGITCLAGMLLSSQPVFSQIDDSIGKVIAIRGKATAVSNGSDSRSLFLKAPVFLDDTIKTKNGRLQMMFKDNTLVTLGRNSEIQVTKYLWEPGNTDSKMETNVQEGSFRIMGGAITRIAPNNFKTNAPSGTIGIRGSMYAGRVQGNSLFVLFQGGKGIYVQNKAGMVDITRPGFGTRVTDAAHPPEEPKKIDTEELQKFETLLAETPEDETNETDSSDKSPDSTDSTGQNDQEDTSSQPKDSGTGESVAESDGAFAEPVGQEEGPTITESTALETVSDISSVISDTTLGSTQSELSETLTPVGTEQEILTLLLGLGFTETEQSTSVPSSGIWEYKGDMKNTQDTSDPIQQMKFIVNWNNKRIIAFEDIGPGPSGMGFAFGDVDASGGISKMKVLGSDAHGWVMALTGSETFGHFYGATQGGLGLALEGYDYNIQDQTQSEFWSDIIAAKFESTSNATYTSTPPWSGFFVGVAEDMADPNTGRRIFFNTDAGSGFLLSINKGTGTFTGSLNGSDFNDGTNSISSSTIGGSSNNSAYITDKILAAEIMDATIDMNGSTGGLKPHGNFLVTANEPMLSDYTTWGYWEVAYEEAGSGSDYHLHVPGSRWIAGLQNNLPINFVGTYQGGARGVRFDSASQMTDLTGGSTTLNIDFTGVSTPVTGTISFDGGINLPVTTSVPGQIAAVGFNATIAGATSSSVNGTFFGPTVTGSSSAGPAAVGGNFNALMPGGMQYHGIFAGDLK